MTTPDECPACGAPYGYCTCSAEHLRELVASLRRELRMLRNQRDTLISERDEARADAEHQRQVALTQRAEAGGRLERIKELEREVDSLRRVVEEAERAYGDFGKHGSRLWDAVDKYRKEQT